MFSQPIIRGLGDAASAMPGGPTTCDPLETEGPTRLIHSATTLDPVPCIPLPHSVLDSLMKTGTATGLFLPRPTVLWTNVATSSKVVVRSRPALTPCSTPLSR
jgi:hypothetical protein